MLKENQRVCILIKGTSVHAERDQRACGKGPACMRKGISVHAADRDQRACILMKGTSVHAGSDQHACGTSVHVERVSVHAS
jgi:hypothetical protein